MWIGEPGKVTDRIDFLGTHEICLYLIRGRDAMIIGGGMAYIVPALERQFSGMDVDSGKIKYLVISHSHFDHCGAVPYLKRRFPQVQILASAYAAEVFSKPKVRDFIAGANKAAIDALGLEKEYEDLNLEFGGIGVDRVIAEGDIVELGDGIEVQFLEMQGHTKCSLAVYVPQLRAMFPSDAAPCPLSDGRGTVIPSPQYDFALYLKSLKRLASYGIDMCAFEHHGVFLGEQAGSILQQGLERTERLRNYVVNQYKEIGDIEKVAQKLFAEVMERNELPFLSSELQADVTRTIIRKILAA